MLYTPFADFLQDVRLAYELEAEELERNLQLQAEYLAIAMHNPGELVKQRAAMTKAQKRDVKPKLSPEERAKAAQQHQEESIAKMKEAFKGRKPKEMRQ